jgi:hypothetical protein
MAAAEWKWLPIAVLPAEFMVHGGMSDVTKGVAADSMTNDEDAVLWVSLPRSACFIFSMASSSLMICHTLTLAGICQRCFSVSDSTTRTNRPPRCCTVLKICCAMECLIWSRQYSFLRVRTNSRKRIFPWLTITGTPRPS